MDDDWDLQAVVRGCSATSTTTSTVTTTSSYGQLFSGFQPQQDGNFACLQDLFQPRKQSFIEELQDLYKPFVPNPQSVLSPVLGRLQDLPLQQQPKPSLSLKTSASPRSKRRKNHLKRVCHVPADSLSSDMWSWRKYGQKPIKGSPHPRGYYKCSTSKGCMARKQVERNRSDPAMFIVTYTADHNHPMPTHRNSLAGSTRQKPATDDPEKPPSCSSPAASLSPGHEKLESSREDREDQVEGEDDEFSVSNMPLDDDFFAGLDELTCPGTGDSSSDHFMQFPWVATTGACGC